jgi:hypothetical protein
MALESEPTQRHECRHEIAVPPSAAGENDYAMSTSGLALWCSPNAASALATASIANPSSAGRLPGEAASSTEDNQAK